MKTRKAPTNPSLAPEYLRQLAYTINRAIDDSNRIPVNRYTASRSLAASDGLCEVDATSGAVALTLPLASSVPGQLFELVKTDAGGNAVSFARSGADTISGSTSKSTSTQWATIKVRSNGIDGYIQL